MTGATDQAARVAAHVAPVPVLAGRADRWEAHVTRLFQISLALAALGFLLAAANPWSKLPTAVTLIWTLGLLGLLVSGPVLLWRKFARRRAVR